MHYSEPEPSAIIERQRRKHNSRVVTLSPCSSDMNLMIEVKNKKQAVFELMKTFKMSDYDIFNDIIPHVRKDDNKPVKVVKKKTSKKKRTIKKDDDDLKAAEEAIEADEDQVQKEIAENEVGMGGPEGRVYWPPGMKHWLRPVKKVVKPKAEKPEKMTSAQKRKAAASETAEAIKVEGSKEASADSAAVTPTPAKRTKTTSKANIKKTASAKKTAKDVPTPSTSDAEEFELSEDSSEEATPAPVSRKAAPARKSARAKKISYAEEEMQVE